MDSRDLTSRTRDNGEAELGDPDQWQKCHLQGTDEDEEKGEVGARETAKSQNGGMGGTIYNHARVRTKPSALNRY